MTNEQALLVLDRLADRGESQAEREAILKAIRCMEKEVAYRGKIIQLLKEFIS